MAAFFFVLCASALFVNSISTQCIGNIGNYGIGNNCGIGNCGIGNYGIGNYGINNAALVGNQFAGLGGCGCGAGTIAPAISASGGGLAVSSASPIAPSGISVQSNNEIGGALEVVGNLPVLAAVALEGNLPTAGSAGVSYSCGDGQVGIISDSLGAAGYGAGYGALANVGLNTGIAGLNAGRIGAPCSGSCGCGIY